MKSAIRNLVLLAGSVFAMAAWGQSASVAVGSATAAAGDTGVVVPVTLTAGQDIAGIDMNVTFTTASQYSSIDVDCTVATVSPNIFDSCSVAGNVVTIQIADTRATTWVDGLLANITVNVDAAAVPIENPGDPLVAVVVGAGDTGGTDLDPLPTSTDGEFTVPSGPKGEFTGTPAGLAMATEQGLANPTGTLTVTNTGEADSTLSGECTLSGDAQISVSNGVFTDIAVGAAGSVVGVACDASAAGSYSSTLSCTHDGSNTSPADFAVTCEIAPPGAASYVSVPVPGSTIEMTPDGDVPQGSTVPDQMLTISNGATDANDNDLVLSNCAWAGSADITATAPTSPIAPQGSTMVTFSCSAATIAANTGTYSCDYDVDGDQAVDGTASYTVNCGVRDAASDITESPANGSTLRIVAPVFGSGTASVSFAETLDEGVDASVDSCTFGDGTNFSVVTALPATVAAGTAVEVTVEGTDPGDGSVSVADVLTCTYTDSDSTPGTVVYDVTLTIQTAAIPTLSTWGLMAMILTMLGLGGIVIRRRVRS